MSTDQGSARELSPSASGPKSDWNNVGAEVSELLEALRMAAYYLGWAMDPNPRFTAGDRQTITKFMSAARATIERAESRS